MTKTKWPGVDPGTPEHATRSYAQKLRAKLEFTSEELGLPDYVYVAWIDLMGAGNLMSTSVHKAANAIARIHLAVHYARQLHGHDGQVLPINDGIFILSKSKGVVMAVMRTALLFLASNFIAKPKHPDRFLVKGAIAYGPVYFGKTLATKLKTSHKKAGATTAFDNVIFGPAVISAYLEERKAPPFGVALHESARSFAPENSGVFRSFFWRWWHENDDGKFPTGTPNSVLPIKRLLAKELDLYFVYMKRTAIYHGVTVEKVAQFQTSANQYFADSYN